jgi:hypothetical protein
MLSDYAGLETQCGLGGPDMAGYRPDQHDRCDRVDQCQQQATIERRAPYITGLES